MKKIMFVCYGNICRSPMAEYLFKDLLKREGKEKEFTVNSSATNNDELGNPVYPPVKRILEGLNIDCGIKRAVKLLRENYEDYDYFIGMDENNVVKMKRLFDGDKEGKVYKLLDFTKRKGDVEDPYWTGNYEKVYSDINEGVKELYCFLIGKV